MFRRQYNICTPKNRVHSSRKQFYYVFSVLTDIADRLGVNYRDISLLTVAEVESLLAGTGKFNKQLVNRRRDGLLAVYQTGLPARMFCGKQAHALFAVAKNFGQKIDELTGAVASVGSGREKIITGKVRIVVNPISDKFEPGEVLVTSMTRIEFVPLMRKAKLIITNEGGIACHAAIVSRELGVPCIIGTKHATELLHDGDRVEADLASGEIKIIN